MITQTHNILLLTKDNSAVDMLHSVLEKSQNIVLSGICQEFSELTSYLKDIKFQTIIVDIDPDPLRILTKVGTITAMYPELRIVVISNSFSNELILHAMHAGARHYLLKSSIEKELEKVLGQILSEGRKSESKQGSIISVIPVSGGCGATTVAVNLANEIRIASSEEILLVDMDSYYATVALHLGISTQYGISDILSHEDMIDENLLKSCSYNYMTDFHILTNKAIISSPELNPPRYDNLTSILEVCKNAYKYTVIDTPSRLDKDVLEKILDLSDNILVVFHATVKDLKLAQYLISSVQFLTAPNKIIPLANNFDKRNSLIKLEDCKQALGIEHIHSICSEPQKALNAFNLSQPLAQFAAKSKMRQDLQQLALALIGVEEPNKKETILGTK
ncbi:MAG: AAA family ATPase [Sedimentisphaerales bacterium]|nr:AAA family ATPase [Sedimentisphaerales bacterium]